MRLETAHETPVALPQHASVEGTGLDPVLHEHCFQPYLAAGLEGSCLGHQWSASQAVHEVPSCCSGMSSGVFGRIRWDVLQAVSLGLSHGADPGALSTGEG